MTKLSSMKEALTILAHHRTDEIVIPHMTAAVLWVTISALDTDVPFTGSMGKASSFGLGLALACPDRRVVILDGDGSLLMNLGTLVTIAQMAPANLVHFVLENGIYAACGGHDIPEKSKIDFAAMAKAAGYPRVYTIENKEDLDCNLEQILHEEGPIFVTLKVGAPPKEVSPLLPWMFNDSTTADALSRLKEVL